MDNRKANLLCTISVICELLPFVILFGTALVSTVIVGNDIERIVDILDVFYRVLDMIKGVFVLTGIILVIYVRIKCPENLFGKVLMIVYLIIGMIVCVATIFVNVMCNQVESCIHTCTECD